MSGYFECKYCNKKFVREANFKKHECRTMKRLKELRTPTGMAAYDYYKLWKSQRAFSVNNELEFVESRYYTAFINFAQFCRKVALPGIDKFIEYMIKKDIQPKDWSQHIVYQHYMEVFDELHDPEQQVDISKNTVQELARIFECDTSSIFLHMEPSALIRIIQAKKFSPWFLLSSSKFKWFVNNEMTREQQIILQKYIDPVQWRRKLEHKPALHEKITKHVRTLGL